MKVLETMLMDLYNKEKEAAEASWCKEQVVMIFQLYELEEELFELETRKEQAKNELESSLRSKSINFKLLKRADTIPSSSHNNNSSGGDTCELQQNTMLNARASSNASSQDDGSGGGGGHRPNTPNSPATSKHKLRKIFRNGIFEVRVHLHIYICHV